MGSETSNLVDGISPNNEAGRVAISSIIGGTTSSLAGGSFTDGAIAAAMQRLFNDEGSAHRSSGATVRLRRAVLTDTYTLDELTVDGTNIKGYALEPAGPSSEQDGSDKRVDPGTYALVKHSGTHFQGVYELADVTGRHYILIHWGNFSENTVGCILPGSDFGQLFNPSNGETEFGVTGSKAFVQELDSYLNQFQNNRIVIEDNP